MKQIFYFCFCLFVFRKRSLVQASFIKEFQWKEGISANGKEVQLVAIAEPKVNQESEMHMPWKLFSSYLIKWKLFSSYLIKWIVNHQVKKTIVLEGGFEFFQTLQQIFRSSYLEQKVVESHYSFLREGMMLSKHLRKIILAAVLDVFSRLSVYCLIASSISKYGRRNI